MTASPGTSSPTSPTLGACARGPHGDARAARATKAEVEARLAAVRRWIALEGVPVDEAVRRLRDAHGLGWRQALRYWTRAYAPLLDERDRRLHARRQRPRGRDGRYRPWPSLLRAETLSDSP